MLVFLCVWAHVVLRGKLLDVASFKDVNSKVIGVFVDRWPAFVLISSVSSVALFSYVIDRYR